MNISTNPSYSLSELHRSLFNGDLLVFTEIKNVSNLLHLSQSLIQDAFGSLDPKTAQNELQVEEFIKIVSPLKSRFTNCEQTRSVIRDIIEELGYDLDRTFFDVPRLRVVTHGNYLSAGVGYAYKPHRDTWYGSPTQQINLWLPVFNINPDSGLLFYPEYWAEEAPNTSDTFDYSEWVSEGRKLAESQVKNDTRNHPLPLSDMSHAHKLVYSSRAGDTLFFSAHHMHGTLPNTSEETRFSIDFRIVTLDDLESSQGPENVDDRSKGTTLGDFIRSSDFQKMDERLIDKYKKSGVGYAR